MAEPILISIAGALATRAATGLYDLVRQKFAGDPDAAATLEAADGAAEDSAQVRELAAVLAESEREDPEFGERLRAEFDRSPIQQEATSGGVTNQFSGEAQKVVQARDVHGDISL